MDKSSLIAIGFLVFGGFFMYSLLKDIWKLITKEWKNEKLNAVTILKHFKMTILSLVLLFLFIAFGVPM